MLWECVWKVVSNKSELDRVQAEIGSYLRAGSLPKNATNVMKEMKSTISAMVVMVPMATVGQIWPVSLSTGVMSGSILGRSEVRD